MTLAQRVGKILSALFSFLCAWIMFRMGEAGFLLVSLMISISLILFGLRSLIFYWTMARHMVDGRTALYIGVIVLDFGFLPCPSRSITASLSPFTFWRCTLFPGPWIFCVHWKPGGLRPRPGG